MGDIGKKSYAPTPKQSGRSIWLGSLTHGLCWSSLVPLSYSAKCGPRPVPGDVWFAIQTIIPNLSCCTNPPLSASLISWRGIWYGCRIILIFRWPIMWFIGLILLLRFSMMVSYKYTDSLELLAKQGFYSKATSLV